MKLLKNKIFLVTILCLTILAGAFYFVMPKHKVSANNDYTLIVQKVDVQVDENGQLLNGVIAERPSPQGEDAANGYTPQDLLKTMWLCF